MSEYEGWARCPGTCGEWIQGAKGGTPFLIGCPIDRYVRVEVSLFDNSVRSRPEMESKPVEFNHSQVGKNQNIRLSVPHRKTKTRKALNILLEQYGLQLGGQINFLSELPIGKGMASSTADLSASLAAVMSSLEIPWEPKSIARIALAIEPTDPVMFPGITEFAHQDGKYIRELGPNVPAELFVLDWGGSLDTQQFNARADLSAHYRKHEATIRKALALFYEGMIHSDLEKMAAAATQSTLCNLEINPKPQAEELISFIRSQGGLGMITAHSGTLVAGVFPKGLAQSQKEDIIRTARLQFSPEKFSWVRTQNGGIESGAKIGAIESRAGWNQKQMQK